MLFVHSLLELRTLPNELLALYTVAMCNMQYNALYHNVL